MLRKLVIVLVCAVAASSIPFFYERNPEPFDRLMGWALGVPFNAPDAPVAEIGTILPVEENAVPSGRQVRIAADPTGHFSADFRINGRKVQGLIDTGATLVAINMTTARRSGISIAQADLIHRVQTANGQTRAAVAMIDSLEIGRIRVKDVEAVILEDSALKDTLIGVSFLKRLARYQVEDGALLLVQ